MIWRIAGVWMVVLAVGLAVTGVVLALQQGKILVVRLMEPAGLKAYQIAETALQQFNGRLHLGFGVLVEYVREGVDTPWDPPDDFPSWLNGLYVWDGGSLHVITTPASHPRMLFDRVRKLVSGRYQRWFDQPRSGPDILYDRIGEEPLVLACLDAVDRRGKPVLIAARIDLELQKKELIEPLLPSDGTFELVRNDEKAVLNPWSQKMFSAMRFWAVQPSALFLDRQKRLIYRYTIVQLILPVLALLTLLVAMAVLLRAIRREIALTTMKSNFVADVTHELKTPLALIHLYGETLQAGRITSEEKKREYYDVILRESTRLTNLINNILDFSRIEVGKKQYHFEPIDIGTVVRDTYQAYTAQLEHQGFEHHLTMEASLPELKADRDAIAQALINLIHNAIKYSDRERYLGIEVTTDVRRGRRGVLISVHDRGIGIRPEDRAHLFEGFFRADHPHVREKSGAGLGLGLVKHIVESHGGSLDVESRLVKGSTFRIFLPAANHLAQRESQTGDPRDYAGI